MLKTYVIITIVNISSMLIFAVYLNYKLMMFNPNISIQIKYPETNNSNIEEDNKEEQIDNDSDKIEENNISKSFASKTFAGFII